MRRRRWSIRDSDPRVPRPPVLNIPLHTTVVEPIRDDDAADVLHALVAHLPFDAQPHRRAMLDRQTAAVLEQAVARAASRGRDPQPQVIDNVAPDEPRRKILYSRPDVRNGSVRRRCRREGRSLLAIRGTRRSGSADSAPQPF